MSVEYLVVVGAVSIGLAAAVAALGPLLVADYAQARAIVSSPEVD